MALINDLKMLVVLRGSFGQVSSSQGRSPAKLPYITNRTKTKNILKIATEAFPRGCS